MLKTIPMSRLFTTEYRTLSQIRGPLVFVERIADVAYNEILEIEGPDGDVRLGQVLDVDQQHCMVRIFIGTSGLDLRRTRVRFTGAVARRDSIPDSQKENAPGVGAWVKRSKCLQQQLIERWATGYGA